MDRNFARALPLVLSHEGGYVNHLSDPGGATNKGVTLATFRAYVKPGGTVADLKAITDEQVATVYYRHYWAAVNAQALPSGIDYAVFDFAVNSGPARAAKYLQAILGVEQDGRVGPKTIASCTEKRCPRRHQWPVRCPPGFPQAYHQRRQAIVEHVRQGLRSSRL